MIVIFLTFSVFTGKRLTFNKKWNQKVNKICQDMTEIDQIYEYFVNKLEDGPQTTDEFSAWIA